MGAHYSSQTSQLQTSQKLLNTMATIMKVSVPVKVPTELRATSMRGSSLVLPARTASSSRRVVTIRATANPPSSSPASTSAPVDAAMPLRKFEGWEELMKFDGGVTERINGRLAMLGFVAAVGAELTTQQSFFTQFANHPLAVMFHWGVFAGASFAPGLMSGNSLQDILGACKADGLPEGLQKFNGDVELMNGRAAMVGVAGLIVVEAVKGGALF